MSAPPAKTPRYCGICGGLRDANAKYCSQECANEARRRWHAAHPGGNRPGYKQPAPQQPAAPPVVKVVVAELEPAKAERKPRTRTLAPATLVKMATPSPFWIKHDAELRDLYAEGLTMLAIGTRLGVTKNAVIGRVTRLGLNVNSEAMLRKQAETAAPTKPRIPDFPRSGHCVFPHGHPGEDGFHWCGAEVAAPGLPYCPSCMARAYVPAGKRVDALKQINFAASNLGIAGQKGKRAA